MGSSQTICSYEITDDTGNLSHIECFATLGSVAPFSGISAHGSKDNSSPGRVVVSGGTRGISVYPYDSATGFIDVTNAFGSNLNTNVVGHPDVAMITESLAALSTD